MIEPAGGNTDEPDDRVADQAPRYYQPWDHRLCFELALNLHPLADILARYSLAPQELDKLLKQPAFKEQIASYKREIKEKGLTFREKARIMAEDLLNTAYDIIHHPASANSTKADLIKWVAKVADLEPKPSAADQQNPLLPAMAETIRKLSDGDLEIQVMRVVQHRKEEKDITQQSSILPDKL